MTEVPDVLMPYVDVDEEGIRLKKRGDDGVVIAAINLPKVKYLSWHAFLPDGMERAPTTKYRESYRLYCLVEGMPNNTPDRISYDGVDVYFSGYPLPIPYGEWIGPVCERVPIVEYAGIMKLMAVEAQAADNDEKKKHSKGEKAVQSVPTVTETAGKTKKATANTGQSAGIGDAKTAEEEAESAAEPRRTYEPLGAAPVPASQFRDFIPEGMRNSNRWGVVKSDKTPYEGGAPEWRRDFEKARRFREFGAGENVHKRVLGYCFGGASNRSTDAAVDPDHGNLTDEEAAKLGKPVGALYMRPDPRYGCIDYDHVLNAETRELRKDLPEDLAAEIILVTSVYRTEVSASGTGLHVIFEKRGDWPTFGKIKQTFGDFGREVFSGKGYVNFTGDRWKDQRPAPTQEQADAAYGLLLGIVNDYLCKNGKRAGPVLQPATKDADVKTPELTREVTTKEQKILRTWMKIEANKVAIQMTREKIGYTADSQASEAMMSVMTRIAGDAAEDAVKHGLPYEAYARPENIRKLWEQSDIFRNHYASGSHDYNESKITSSINKAIDTGRQKYNELSKTAGKTREKTHGKAEEKKPEEQPEYTPEQAEEARKIWEEGRMLEYLEADIHAEHRGDDPIIRTMLLSAAGINVVNSEGIHIGVCGATGTGKSHVAKTVTRRMPRKMVLDGGLSDKALFYHNIPDGTIIVMDEEEMSESMQETMKVSTTAWNESATHRTVLNGKTVTLQTPARSPWWVIKTNTTGDEQVLDRQIIVWADDSEEQQAAILREIMRQGCNPDAVTREHGICKALWAQLPTAAVMIPYADNIGIGNSTEPRNLKLFLDIIKSHALLHAPSRQTDMHDWIIAEKDDFDAACRLFNPLIHSKGGSQIHKLTPDEQKVLDVMAARSKQEWTYTELAGVLQIDKNRVIRAIKGRHDGRHDSVGLEGKTSMIDVVVTSEETETNPAKHRRFSTILWRKEAYDTWKKQTMQGFYWQENEPARTL